MSRTRDLGECLRVLGSSERATVDAALAADPELAADLRPLLDGRYGERTERLFLNCFAARLRQTDDPRAALLPALADAMREAERADHSR
jgi:hypothetical protein